MAQAETMTLLDAIETKLKDTKRVPFVSRVIISAKIVDGKREQDHSIVGSPRSMCLHLSMLHILLFLSCRIFWENRPWPCCCKTWGSCAAPWPKDFPDRNVAHHARRCGSRLRGFTTWICHFTLSCFSSVLNSDILFFYLRILEDIRNSPGTCVSIGTCSSWTHPRGFGSYWCDSCFSSNNSFSSD
jgi:hypothetical protein